MLSTTFFKNILVVIFFSVAFISKSHSQNFVEYTEANEVISNPERGLQKYSITNNNYNTTSNYSNLNENTLRNWREGDEKVTVLFRYFQLNNFLNSDISSTYLDNIQKDFDIIRSAGLKCIVRFSYSNEQGSTPQQATKAFILSHLQQLKPVLENNKDVIFSHQAGFIGTWGEWYYTNSEEFGTDGSINQTQWANRKEVIEAMLNVTPEDIFLQVRYPAIKKTMYGTGQLDENSAYKNTANARIGFFNDAFLNNWGDMGTFSVGSQSQTPVGTADYIYLANEAQYTPVTGETNGLNPPRTDAENALFEMNETNWTCINRDYHSDVWQNWIDNNKKDEILKNLGYRFVLENSTFEINSNTLEIEIAIKNRGYARILKEKNVYLVLRDISNSQNSFTYNLESDPRRWVDNISISQNINISDLPNGSYESYLYIPDIYTNLHNIPAYSIQFANENSWEEETGYNKLHQKIIKNNQSTIVKSLKTNTKVEVVLKDNYIEFSGIEINNFNNYQVIISDITGKTIYNKKLENNRLDNLSNLFQNKGLYIITLVDNKNIVTNKKIIL